MYESAYYPAGAAHDPRAPWNQPEPVYTEYDVLLRVFSEEPQTAPEDIRKKVEIKYYEGEDLEYYDILDMISRQIDREEYFDYEILDYTTMP